MNTLIRTLSQQEQLNFLLTNRIPRRLATRFMGWFSRIESPRLTRLTIALWQLFADDLNLAEARQQRFSSLQACFTRQLTDGARTIDARDDVIVSPCDAIIGAHGAIDGTTVFQAKGFPYELADLIPDPAIQEKYRNGVFITLRLKSSMYHRFHAPLDCSLDKVTYISGDTWNVNPIALKRIEKLYCKNERAVLDLTVPHPASGVCLVAVAAILVASIKLHCLEGSLDRRYQGPSVIACNSHYARGDEIGYFQHGSTIIVFATADYQFCENITTGARIQMGQALLALSADTTSTTPMPPQEQQS